MNGGVSASVGMVGAGQLARMSHQAAIDLGIELHVLAVSDEDPAVLAGARHALGDPFDRNALTRFGIGKDVVTLDHELVSYAGLVDVASTTPVVPTPDALRFAQDKAHARRELDRLGFPVPAFAICERPTEVAAFAARHGWPVVLKAATMGYDGRGVEVVGSEQAAAGMMSGGGIWVVEEMLDLAVELAVVVARRPSGHAVGYPVVETVQEDGICVELVQPARVDEGLAAAAADLALDIVGAIDGAGIVAIELFVTAEGALLVNELATRPHNSGHATIEGSVTSQFHNHLRAVLDWPLGDTAMRAPHAAMVNLLGGETGSIVANLPAALEIAGASVHLYGKKERPGRKVGHVTALGDTAEGALATARMAAEILGGST